VSDYPGDSPAKQIARMQMWNCLLDIMSNNSEPHDIAARDMPTWDASKLRNERFLVLASKACGDVATLIGCGIEPSQIIACDLDTSAISACRDRFPGVEIYHGDVIEAARKTRPSVAFLDFCAPWWKETGDISHGVLREMPRRSHIAIAVLKGREGDRMAPAAITNRSARRAGVPASNCSARSALGLFGPHPRPLPGPPPRLPDTSRIDLMHTWLQERNVHDRELVPLFWQSYKSDTDGRSGSPMLMVAWKIRRPRGWREIAGARGHLRTRRPERAVVEFVVGQTSTADVRRVAASHGFSRDACLQLNIAPGTAAAWKAHATRGTYANYQG